MIKISFRLKLFFEARNKSERFEQLKKFVFD